MSVETRSTTLEVAGIQGIWIGDSTADPEHSGEVVREIRFFQVPVTGPGAPSAPPLLAVRFRGASAADLEIPVPVAKF
jgi:hypothetical protein